jgi:diguanylate cyclase (GGDEF)-like protein
MRKYNEILPPGQVDPTLLHRLFYIDHLCLAGAGIVALMNLFPGIFSEIQNIFPASWLDMRTSCSIMTLCAVVSLFLSEETQPKRWKYAGRMFGMLTAGIATASLLADVSGFPVAVTALNWNQISLRQGTLGFPAAALSLLSIAILLVSSEKRIVTHVADGAVLLSLAVSLSFVLECIFERIGIEESTSLSSWISIPSLWCITLLAAVVVFRRSERGFLSVMLGYGTGSRVVRMLAPVMVLLPLLREIARADLLKARIFPAHYAGAILTATGTVVGLILLLLLGRSMNRMQENVQSMTLRDELTGLFNLRGFYLLAEQACKYSRRVQEPFGVLFVDMDNLKIINDHLGHSAGSIALVETAKLLIANFRETDVIGRVGGDEFLVAGQFSQCSIKAAIERLREMAARKNLAAAERFSISLSMGYAVSEKLTQDSLRDLVKQADEAMYEEKHAKKKRRAASAAEDGAAPQGEGTQSECA